MAGRLRERGGEFTPPLGVRRLPARRRLEGTVHEHSLGWVCARNDDELVGFVNLAWDGRVHAFILDTMVATSVRGQGVGTQLVSIAAAKARAAGCGWLHVDFWDHLRVFYFDACGFTPTTAGLIRLR